MSEFSELYELYRDIETPLFRILRETEPDPDMELVPLPSGKVIEIYGLSENVSRKRNRR